MAKEPKLAKSVKATSSLRISFSPRNEPAVTASAQGTPMMKATGAKA